jgi:hypothetical protein
VLHDGHELDNIVPKVADARQDVVGELFVCRDFAVGRGDSDVGLVNAGALGLRGALVLENVLVGRVPETGIVDGGDTEVLGDAGDPGGEALLACVVVGNDKGDLEGQRCAELRRQVQYLELGVVGNCRLAVDTRHGNLKDAVLVLLHGGSITVPVVEVADKVGAQGVGGPFAVDDVAVIADLEAELLVASRELFEAALCVVNGLYPLLSFCVAALEGTLEGVEVRVELADAWMVSRWTGSIAGSGEAYRCRRWGHWRGRRRRCLRRRC